MATPPAEELCSVLVPNSWEGHGGNVGSNLDLNTPGVRFIRSRYSTYHRSLDAASCLFTDTKLAPWTQIALSLQNGDYLLRDNVSYIPLARINHDQARSLRAYFGTVETHNRVASPTNLMHQV
jgi:hypothetical protein